MDIEVKMPDIGVEEVEVIEILVKVNEKIELEQGLATVEGEKASMEIPSPVSGIVKNIYINIGDKVKTSSVLMLLSTKNINSNANNTGKNSSEIEKTISSQNKYLKSNNFKKNIFVHATPVIRRLARQLNVELHNVVPTGRKNRILKEDLELYIKKFSSQDLNNNPLVYFHSLDEADIKKIKLSNLQKITGDNLQKNWKNIPHVTQFDEFDITILEKFRQKYNTQNSKNHNVTILAFILKVVSCALEQFPLFNSSLSKDKEIVLKNYINIGVAVDVKDGLLVPVLKDVNKKNIKELADELIFISEKARQKKLNQSDMTNGSFTISNLGGIGGSWFSPIINAPEVAILGVSKSQIKPLWNGKEFIPSLMLPLSLSYDHRVINGADAARFIAFIGKLLSDMHFLIM